MAERPLKVLVVEDDAVSGQVVVKTLALEKTRPFETVWVKTLGDALNTLESGEFPVVVLDLNLPDSSGIETFRRVGEAAPESAIVLLTGLSDEAAALEAMQSGAQDYLVKGPIDSLLLVRAVRYAHERKRARRETEKLKDEFLHHVSHELRSPLTAIYQAVQLLAEGIAGEARPDQKRLAAIALRNSEHLKSMIDDLLETTRAETGKLIVEPRRVDAGKVAADVAAEKKLAADHRGVSFAVEIGKAPLVYADPVRVRQVLMNLVDNALKFTPKGGTLTLSCGPSSGEAGKVVMSVTDTGPGLSPEDCRYVFDRLYQAKGVHPATGERKGLGLGLYISREIVVRSGGRIWVESEPGKGASFKFTLPVFWFADVVAGAVAAGAKSAALAFLDLYPPGHGLAEASARMVRLECAAMVRRQSREGESILPEIAPAGAEGMVVVAAREPADGGASFAERLRGVLAAARVVTLHRLKPSVDVEVVSPDGHGLTAALEAAVERRLALRVAAAREAGVLD
ncbi:hybrid sensor histidine kinase/response regulator [bacterium]|nr:MAG: hybrid sensor histidine kinase/response regulator [bacterium]